MRSFVFSLGLAGVAACGSSPAASECSADLDCGGANACVDGVCLNPARLDCVPGETAQASLRVPDRVDFGAVGGAVVVRELVLESTGDCSLEVYTARLMDGAAFECPCSESFPATILPGRSLRLPIQLRPDRPGQPSDTLVLTHNAGSSEVALQAETSGRPVATVVPERLDFGFVSAGDVAVLNVQLLNTGAGRAPLTVTGVTVEPGDSPFAVGALDLPRRLDPVELSPTAAIPIEVRFQPGTVAAFQGTLVIGAGPDTVRVPLQSAAEAPVLTLASANLDFGTVRLGEAASREVIFQNTGPTLLRVETRLQDGMNPDLSIEGDVRSLVPGAVRRLRLSYAPTRPNTLTDVLQFQSNDPTARTGTLPITGRSDPEDAQVLTLDMSFDAGEDTFLDLDLRDVDVALESPDGLLCGESQRQGRWDRSGRCLWQGPRPDENRERLILSRVTVDGRYPVLVTYAEDCASLPTALTASLLGIGTDELIDALAEEDVMLDPSVIEAAIRQACVQRSETSGEIVVRADGVLLARVPFQLRQQGQRATPLTLLRGPEGFRVE